MRVILGFFRLEKMGTERSLQENKETKNGEVSTQSSADQHLPVQRSGRPSATGPATST